MTEWPLVLKKPGASDVVCFNATAQAISASSRTAIRFQGNDLHRPPWSRLDLPVWLDLLNPGREARFRRPSTDTPRLEVRFARGGIEEERIYDLIDLEPVPPGLPGLPAGFQLCPRSSDGPRTLPVVALRRRGGDNGLLNDTADVFCVNTTAEPFVVSAFRGVKATLHFPVPSPGEPCSWHNAGLTARFEKGVCRLIGARLCTLGALFTLEGRVLDGMSEGAFVTLIESLGAQAQLTLGSVQAPRLGLKAGKWEFSDSYFSDVYVMAPTGSERTLPQE